ncbi:MAG: 30S ribosomal protein S9 [Candidatus Firestonebacteria bacterium]
MESQGGNLEELATKEKVKNIITVGRRKTAVAKVVMREGDGKITVNGIEMNKYFTRLAHQVVVKKPLDVLGVANKFDIKAFVSGGGIASQSDALRLGIARALLQVSGEYKTLLSKNNLLTRDPRMVERKKYGRPGARKRFQFSKR